MNKKIITPIKTITLIFVVALLAGCSNNTTVSNVDQGAASANNDQTEKNAPVIPEAPIKEFNMESFNSTVDGAYAPRFSLEKITVNKGDLVRIKVNTTSGKHDLKIDEFDVFAETPEGEVTIVEFVADRIGEFIYYCSKGKHRDLGQWGTLIVTQ